MQIQEIHHSPVPEEQTLLPPTAAKSHSKKLPFGHCVLCGRVTSWKEFCVFGGTAATVSGLFFSYLMPNQYYIPMISATIAVATGTFSCIQLRKVHLLQSLDNQLQQIDHENISIGLTTQKAHENMQDLNSQVLLLVSENEKFQKESLEVKENYLALQKTYGNLETEHQNLKDLYQKLNLTNQQLGLQIAQLQNIIRRFTDQLVKFNKQNIILNEQLKKNNEHVSQSEKENLDLDEKIKLIDQEIEEDINALALEIKNATTLSKQVMDCFIQQNDSIKKEIDRLCEIINKVQQVDSHFLAHSQKIESLHQEGLEKKNSLKKLRREYSLVAKEMKTEHNDFSNEVEKLGAIQINMGKERKQIFEDTLKFFDITQKLGALADRFEQALDTSVQLEKQIRLDLQKLEELE